MSGAPAPAPVPAPPPPPAGVGGGRPPLSGLQKGLIGGAALAALVALYWLGGGWGAGGARDEVEGSSTPAGMSRPVSLPPPAPPPTPASLAVGPPPQAPLNPVAARRPAPPRRPTNVMAWEERGQVAAATRTGGDDEGRGAGADPDDQLAARLTATDTPAVRARRLRDPDLTVTQGAVIPCTRAQPVNTQLPGFVSCRVPVDVFGTTGTVALIPAGTKVVGQIRQAMMQGTNRAFVLWTRLETPDHVTVALASPGTDAIGQNGIEVDVHTNFWARFGGAIMLSFIDAGLQAAAIAASSAFQSGSNGGQHVNLYSLQSGGRGAAARALDATVNIPPWGTAPQGEPESIFVARDLDFSAVYRLRSTRP